MCILFRLRTVTTHSFTQSLSESGSHFKYCVYGARSMVHCVLLRSSTTKNARHLSVYKCTHTLVCVSPEQRAFTRSLEKYIQKYVCICVHSIAVRFSWCCCATAHIVPCCENQIHSTRGVVCVCLCVVYGNIEIPQSVTFSLSYTHSIQSID